MFGDWGTVEAPPNAVLTVEVEKLDGPDGNVLFSTRMFDEEDLERLNELKSSYLKQP